MKAKCIKSMLLMVGLLYATTAMRAQDGLDRSATEVINDMVPGWNLGNTLEATTSWTGAALWNNKGGLNSETGWQDTKTSQEIIDFVKSLGFKSHVRGLSDTSAMRRHTR